MFKGRFWVVGSIKGWNRTGLKSILGCDMADDGVQLCRRWWDGRLRSHNVDLRFHDGREQEREELDATTTPATRISCLGITSWGIQHLGFDSQFGNSTADYSSPFALKGFRRMHLFFTPFCTDVLPLIYYFKVEWGLVIFTTVAVVRNEEGENSVSTVVLRGSTDSILDDLEKAVDDGMNTYKAMSRDSRIVPGAAATEIESARRLKEFSFKETGCCM